MGGGFLDRGASVAEVIIVRSSGPAFDRAIVTDLESRPGQPPPVGPHVIGGDVVVVPRATDRVAAEWGPIADFAAGRITRRDLIDRLWR